MPRGEAVISIPFILKKNNISCFFSFFADDVLAFLISSKLLSATAHPTLISSLIERKQLVRIPAKKCRKQFKKKNFFFALETTLADTVARLRYPRTHLGGHFAICFARGRRRGLFTLFEAGASTHDCSFALQG